MSALPSFTVLALPPMRDALPLPPPTYRHPAQIAQWERKTARARKNYWRLLHRGRNWRCENKWSRVIARMELCDRHCTTRRWHARRVGTGAFLCMDCWALWSLCASCCAVSAALDDSYLCEHCAGSPRARWFIAA